MKALDALEALQGQRDGLALVGAQAIYLCTGDADVAIATTTKDSNVALIPSPLPAEPTLDEAMIGSHFSHDRSVHQPGEWAPPGPGDPPVELRRPGRPSRRRRASSARIPPHSERARVVPGLEAVAVSHRSMTITSLEPESIRDASRRTWRVRRSRGGEDLQAGRASRGSAESLARQGRHDLYRLLRAVRTQDVVVDLEWLLTQGSAGTITHRALAWLDELARDADSLLPAMAGRAEEILGDPVGCRAGTLGPAQDVLNGMR